MLLTSGKCLWQVLLLQAALLLMPATAALYEGDPCSMNTINGECTLSSKCTTLEAYIKRGELSGRDVVSCGFDIQEEIICCPTGRPMTATKPTPTDTGVFVFEQPTTTTTTAATPARDFWEGLLTTTVPSVTTTTQRDFWLDLLSSTTTTTTTTPRPLVVGDQELDTNSEFFDFSKLLNGQPNETRKQQQQQQNVASENPERQRNRPRDINEWTQVPQENREPPAGNAGFANSRPLQGNREPPAGNTFNAGFTNVRPNQNNREPATGVGVNFGFGKFVPQGNQRPGPPQAGGFPPQPNRGIGFGFGHGRGPMAVPHVPPANLFGQQRARSSGPNWQNGLNNGPNWQNGPNNEFRGEPAHGGVVFPGRGGRRGSWPGTGNRGQPHAQWRPDDDVESVNPAGSSIWSNQPAQLRDTEPVRGNRPQDLFTTGAGVQTWNNAPSQQPSSNVAGNFANAANNFLPQHMEQQHQRPNAFNRPTGQEIPTTQVAPQTQFDPITAVNENLVNAGLDMVTAQLTNFESDWQRQHQQQPQQQQQPEPQHQQQQPEQHHNNQHFREQHQPNLNSPISTSTKDPFVPFQFQSQPENESNDIETDWTHAVHSGANAAPNTFFTDISSSSKKPNPSVPSIDPPTVRTPTTVVTPVISRSDERPSVRACRELDKGLEPALSPHILDGTPVELGEYPHMAAIGFTTIGNEVGPYDFRCGGTLIDKRFVLTAAHCVTDRASQPAVVRLGVTNFTDEEQMRQVVEVRVQKVHIHPNYTNSRKYNDIALLELQTDVENTANVYPCCLYTELADPPLTEKLFVTGWGTINTRTRQVSSQLLKARLQITSLDSCNASYAIEGTNRQLPRGIDPTQLCATDPGETKDACQGDSGGPLNLVLDESLKKYRIVGIISAGFSCGTRTPGLYTRVSSFLDYIESVVWPLRK